MGESLARELLHKYRELIYSRYGIQFHGDKQEVLGMKLVKLANARGLSLREFYGRVAAGERVAVDELLRAITVGHTFFFREEPHLQYLIDDIGKNGARRVLIWCAASSTGEEPYSIVIYLLEHGISDFLIVSSDVNASALMTMDRGVYNVNKFQSTDASLLRKYFREVDEYTLRVRTGLRGFLRIKRLNLHSDILFERQFDYIFCRNVLIYFDDDGRQKVLENLVRNLKPSGLLFVGHSEAVLSLPRDMRKEAPAVFRRVS
jgi:chemotaxis protein methyltransferase CheR